MYILAYPIIAFLVTATVICIYDAIQATWTAYINDTEK
jgi:hypothetical protein